MTDAEEFKNAYEQFDAVEERFGGEMFKLVLNTGLASEAVKILAEDKCSRSQRINALRTLGEAFNTVSNAYVIAKGWSGQELADCDNAMVRAMHGELITTTAPSLILPN